MSGRPRATGTPMDTRASAGRGAAQGMSSASSWPEKRLAVRLADLHDRDTGRLDAVKVAEYLRIPLKQLSEALGRNYSTVHRTPSASGLQERLCSIKSSLVILEDVLGDRSSALIWLNSPNPDLGKRTPMEVLLEGRVEIIEDMLKGALEGVPS